MIIIYQCFGGAHSSVLAAAIHIRMLPPDRVPLSQEIINLPLYDKTPESAVGVPFFYGIDEGGNQVYVQGLGRAGRIVQHTLESFLELEGLSREEVYLKNTLKYVNILVRVGGFLSRGLGIIFPGRFLTVLGLKLSYRRFVKLVRGVKGENNIA